MSIADATASGLPYPIQAVSGQDPTSLDQFVGENVFTILKNGAPSVVFGAGAMSGDCVRFHEQDLSGAGKDIRVWEIRPAADGSFTASSVSAF
jgi:hypothetical protein